MNGALNLGLSGMSQMGWWQHSISSCLDPDGFVLSVPQNVAPLFLEGKLGPVCHSSELSSSSLAQKFPGKVRDSSSPWGLQQMFNAAKANLFVNLMKSSCVFLLFQILGTLMYIKHLGWSVSQRLLPGNTSLGSLLEERERERYFFSWSSLLKNNP